MVGTLVLPLPKCGVIRSTWCVLGLPSRHWGPWLSNSRNESSICCPKFRLRDQHICACQHRSCLAYVLVQLALWGVLPLPSSALRSKGNIAGSLFHGSWATCSFFTPLSSLTRILCPVQLAQAQWHSVVFACLSCVILHLEAELLFCCNWSKLQSEPHSSMTRLHTVADFSHFFPIYSDRSYSSCVHFFWAVFVSSPNLETNRNNEVIFFFSGTFVSYSISGKQVQAPFLEFLCWGYLST